MCNAFVPELSALGSALASKSKAADSNSPEEARFSIGEASTAVARWLVLQPFASNFLITSRTRQTPRSKPPECELETARSGVSGRGWGFFCCSGVSCGGFSAAFGSAPSSSNNIAKSVLPAPSANIKGVVPRTSRASTEAFRSSNNRAMATVTCGVCRQTSSTSSCGSRTREMWQLPAGLRLPAASHLQMETKPVSSDAPTAMPLATGSLPSSPRWPVTKRTSTAAQSASLRPSTAAALRLSSARSLHRVVGLLPACHVACVNPSWKTASRSAMLSWWKPRLWMRGSSSSSAVLAFLAFGSCSGSTPMSRPTPWKSWLLSRGLGFQPATFFKRSASSGWATKASPSHWPEEIAALATSCSAVVCVTLLLRFGSAWRESMNFTSSCTSLFTLPKHLSNNVLPSASRKFTSMPSSSILRKTVLWPFCNAAVMGTSFIEFAVDKAAPAWCKRSMHGFQPKAAA
mmetsp:Transcript_37040/g.106916  ORF Transcript_37040/g.106916 Transcript_37040/m.106916 type:complete len:460 (+) Transcript_37040:1902-3281(+)